MHNEIQFRVERMKRCNATIAEDLAFIDAWNDAVGMAYEERTGVALGDGEKYSVDDAERADEIMKLFPSAGA
jgi:hypothetical protein